MRRWCLYLTPKGRADWREGGRFWTRRGAQRAWAGLSFVLKNHDVRYGRRGHPNQPEGAA